MEKSFESDPYATDESDSFHLTENDNSGNETLGTSEHSPAERFCLTDETTDENPHAKKTTHHQTTFKVNVWAGIVDNNLMPSISSNNLNDDNLFAVLDKRFTIVLQKPKRLEIPELLRRYPIQDHKDFPMPLDMVYFCQPEGCSSVGPRRTALREASSFVFTLTDKDSGKTRYGICVNFYRPIEKTPANLNVGKGRTNTNLRRDSWRKSMEKSSDSAFSSDYRSSNVGPSDSEKDCPSRRDSESTTGNLPRLGVIPANDSESGGSHSPSPRASRRRQRIRNLSLTSLCILSHHPFFSMFRECLFILKKLIDACNESSNPRRVGGSKQLFRDNVWSVLTGHATDTTSSIVIHDVKEIETWILKLLSSPVPIPGKTKVELEVLSPTVYDPLVFALPNHTRFSLVDFPLHLPLELLAAISSHAFCYWSSC
ncbi:unnamed protein product [Diabrotica balteata]|uniref:UDENN domain-containing protein n=1 Tax=Diabrotica balteata TaxID=107213 RepID=A0A9N9XE65_DIABA|nr:unnamed protein product [Diabrotica balteata]